jgi:C1A family cysteine protease
METQYAKLDLSQTNKEVGTGWLPPMPDLRDYTKDQKDIKAFLRKLGVNESKNTAQASVDLRQYCSPVKNQGKLNSCTAHVVAGIVEYYENRAFNKHIEASRLFLYKTTRNLMQVNGDAGGWLRHTMGALVLCGVPAEKYWPYDENKVDIEPDAFVYSIADDCRALKYFCHDPLGARVSYPDVLTSVKNYLEAGIPSMFGFWGFPSFNKSDVIGGIPYPAEGESAQWGHAFVTVGYDDTKRIKNTVNNKETIGALLIRNSRGTEWGEEGYGWIPYDYVLNNLALDFWTLLSMEWVDSNQFGI